MHIKYLTVIKTLAYFPQQVALNGNVPFNALLDSAQAAGIQTKENSYTADAAVIWSVLWHGRLKTNQAVYEHYRQQNKPVIIVEIGALYRGQTWKVSVNNVTAEGFYGHQDQLDWDRARKLKISLAQQTQTTPHVIIALQHSHSLQVASIADMTQWVSCTVDKLKTVTDRPIVVRPHPRSRCALPPGVTVEQPQKLAGTYDSYNMHFDCHAVVNYNSGPGIQAAIAGVRPLVDSTSLAAPVGVNWTNIEQPYTVDRDRWLTEICHTEYTVEEIQRGLWLNRLAPALTA
jgi:hypothetical protein